ncbi:paralemmin-1-like [Tachysurus vachellii]|uniref:paralemmin-1-like n=1 Tax=Tachysurus vachellii TaxID=175792 RepID=UPI00296AB807|nr:paralemmin-1-like [Tachysurus vachellii]XP_060748966.1 paralemmin-1-like [Tachysurus vachellii]XP_060748967.1 paralemmin-1-like [Tachysurus vachellii]
MDEAEKYQQRLQAIAEKRLVQEEEEKVRREMEKESLKHAQHKRKYLREQWLMESTPSTPEDPNLHSVIPALQSTEQSAENSERQMKKEVEKTEVINDNSSQIGENEPLILSADNPEEPTQAYLREDKRNVLGVLEVEAERNLVSESAQKYTEEKRKAKTEEQETEQLEMDAVEPVDLPHHLLTQITTPDEAHFSLAGKKTELIMAEDVAEDEEWEMVNCGPEEDLDLVLTSDLIQVQSNTGLEQKGHDAILKVEQVFIMDEEEDVEVGTAEVLSLVVSEKKSDLEDTSCEKPPEHELQTLYLEKVAHASTSAPLKELSNVSGIISEESSVECKQNMPHLPAHTAHAPGEILRANTEYKEDQSLPISRIVKVEWKDTSGPEDEVHHYIPLDREREKSPALKKGKMVAHGTEPESEIQILMPHSGTPKRAETKRKTCHCCTVM